MPTTYGNDIVYCLKSHCGVRGYCRQKWVLQVQIICKFSNERTCKRNKDVQGLSCGFEVELGYSLPKNLWRNTTVISGIRLFVRGTNLLTFSKFDLWDPEVENTTGAAYPIMKSLSAGFEIKF